MTISFSSALLIIALGIALSLSLSFFISKKYKENGGIIIVLGSFILFIISLLFKEVSFKSSELLNYGLTLILGLLLYFSKERLKFIFTGILILAGVLLSPLSVKLSGFNIPFIFDRLFALIYWSLIVFCFYKMSFLKSASTYISFSLGVTLLLLFLSHKVSLLLGVNGLILLGLTLGLHYFNKQKEAYINFNEKNSIILGFFIGSLITNLNKEQGSLASLIIIMPYIFELVFYYWQTLLLKKKDIIFYHEKALKDGLEEKVINKALFNISIILGTIGALICFAQKGILVFLLLGGYFSYSYLMKLKNVSEPEPTFSDLKNNLINDIKNSCVEVKENIKKIKTIKKKKDIKGKNEKNKS